MSVGSLAIFEWAFITHCWDAHFLKEKKLRDQLCVWSVLERCFQVFNHQVSLLLFPVVGDAVD